MTVQLKVDRKEEGGRVESDMQRRTTGWNRTYCCCSKDLVLVCRADALPGELLGHPV